MRRLMTPRWRHEHRRTLRAVVGTAASLTLVAALSSAAVAASANSGSGFGDELVGHTYANGVLLPTNQWVKPIGTRILDRQGRLLSSAISPNGKYLAALSWNEFTGYLTMFNLETGKMIQRVGYSSELGDGTVAADGPLWSADGTSLWFPQTADLVHFSVGADGKVAPNPAIITLETTIDNLTTGPVTVPDLPSGMALSDDGTKLYVALNGVNKLGIIDTTTNKLIQVIKTGNAPRQVVLVGNNAYVSNEGGKRAKRGEFTNESDGTPIVASKVTGAATSGTVSVVDLAENKQVNEISVGLEPTAEYLGPDGTLMVANSNDDSVSLIDTATNKVVQTFNVNPLPGSTVGSNPNAIYMPNAHTILVSIGRDNALAVYGYSGPNTPVSYEGLLPTDFYPVAVAYDPAIGKLVVTNDKGIGARGLPKSIDKGPDDAPAPNTVTGPNTYSDTGSLTEFTMPGMAALGGYTHQVFVNNGWEHLLASKPLSDCKAAPRAVPTRLGCPSPIKHIFLIIRENRTYDQVLGDIGKGNSDPSYAQFGATITPNYHALADDFGLFDNFYDEGTLSADGHNWLVQADANDYIEKEFGAFYRSYPAQGGDALAYQRDGFIWNDAESVGLTAKSFGEYNNFLTQPAGVTWSDYYQDARIMQGKTKGPMPVPVSATKTYADIPSLNSIDYHDYPAFDLSIPDQYRADIWAKSFATSVKTGQLANLNLIWLPDDHTAGVGTGDPYPVAEVADNDLAMGRIIDKITHSPFWSSSAIFVDEDDTQNGVDHVDGHRSPLLVISPYAKRGVINNTYYTQLNVVKTIEQILGMPPMNQEDRAATPMFNAFTNTPDYTPYAYQPNQIPLTKGLHASVTNGKSTFVPATPAQLGIPHSEWGLYGQWVVWSRSQHFNGHTAIADWANPAQLNRLIWYTAHDWKVPYPGDKSVLPPAKVPGANLPSDYLGD